MDNGTFCPHCGAKNSSDAVYCENCGEKLSANAEALSRQNAPQSAPKKKSYKMIWISILCAVVIGAGIFAWFAFFKTIDVDLTSNITKENVSMTGVSGDGEAYLDSGEAKNLADYNRGNRRAEKFMDSVTYTVSPSSGLENGDDVVVKAKYSQATAQSLHINAANLTKTIKVSGLDEKENEGSNYTYREGYTGSDYYIFPNSDTEYLTEADLSGKTAWELKAGRNEIYARHGYIFKSSDLKNYFESQDWYVPTYTKSEWDESWLSSVEARNVNFILNHE